MADVSYYDDDKQYTRYALRAQKTTWKMAPFFGFQILTFFVS